MILLNANNLTRELAYANPNFDNYNKKIVLTITKLTQVYNGSEWITITDSYIPLWKSKIITNDKLIELSNKTEIQITDYIEKRLHTNEFPTDGTLSFLNTVNYKVYKLVEGNTYEEVLFETGQIIKLDEDNEYWEYSGGSSWGEISVLGERDYLMSFTYQEMGGTDITEKVYDVMSNHIDTYLIDNGVVKGSLL